MSYDSSISLDALPRPVSGKGVASKLRREGLVPVTLYGGGGDAASGSVGRREFTAIIRSQGRNSIFNLNLAGSSTPVKIADMQLHPVKGTLMHLDLMRISLTEKTEFEVRVDTVGEADGVKHFNGVLDQPTHSLRIRCLPTDVPQEIEIDVSGLGIGDHFRVSDLKIDRDKIEVLADDELVLATVVAARVEEEPVPAGDEPVEPEVIKKGKPEDEA